MAGARDHLQSIAAAAVALQEYHYEIERLLEDVGELTMIDEKLTEMLEDYKENE